MKKSKTVRLTLMASMAVVACRHEERRCVDWNDQTVPEKLCSEASPTPGPGRPGGYRWIYVGGAHVGGATGVRSNAAPATDGAHSGVSRGGFGESAGAHSGASSGAHGGGSSSGGHGSSAGG